MAGRPAQGRVVAIAAVRAADGARSQRSVNQVAVAPDQGTARVAKKKMTSEKRKREKTTRNHLILTGRRKRRRNLQGLRNETGRGKNQAQIQRARRRKRRNRDENLAGKA